MSSRAPSPSTTKRDGYPTKQLLSAVASLTRWKMLNAMSDGEGVMVSTLATRIGETPTNVSKHMLLLLKAGLVRVGPGRLYHYTDLSRPDPVTNEVDLGAIVLRFPKRQG